MKLGIIITVSFLLAGCASLFPIQVTDPRTGIEYTVPARLQNVPGIKELAEACATKAGRVVHRTVEVEGYYLGDVSGCDEACWSSFAQSRYQFLEFEIKEIQSWLFLKEKGLWRISKQDVKDARCEAKPTRYVKRISERDGWPVEFCLAFERVESLKSAYRPDYSSIDVPFGIVPEGRLVEGRNIVTNMNGTAELAYDISYTLFGVRGTMYQGLSWGCSSIGITPQGRGSGKILAKEVLKPK